MENKIIVSTATHAQATRGDRSALPLMAQYKKYGAETFSIKA
jgi:hypothetical protein